MIWVIWTLALLAIIFTIWRYVRHNYDYWKRHGVPHTAPTIPLGNMKGATTDFHVHEIFDKIYFEHKNCGPFVGTYLMFQPCVLAVDLEFIKKILIKDFQCFDERGTYYNERDDPLSAHLFAIDSTAWRMLRSKLSPTFTSGKMKFMYPTIMEVADRFNEHLGNILKDEQTTLEVKDLLGRFTTDIIGTCAFGIECNSLTDPNAQFLKMGRKVFNEQRHPPWMAFLMQGWPNVARYFGLKITLDDVSEFFMNLVKETVEYREKNNIQRNDFMDILIRLKNDPEMTDGGQLTLNEIAAQAFVFFLAGFETSSTTMTFALYELADNQDLQERVRQEVVDVLEEHDGNMSYEASMDMKYLDQVINETLRKYPPIPMHFRKATKPYYVPEYDYTIPVGQSVQIPVYAIHHDPEYYPNPSVFDPDRFSPEAVRERNPLAFTAFGDGPRNCIGLRFGMMQTRVGLAMLLKNYKFSIGTKTTHPVVLTKKDFILSPVDGMWLDVQKRVDA